MFEKVPGPNAHIRHTIDERCGRFAFEHLGSHICGTESNDDLLSPVLHQKPGFVLLFHFFSKLYPNLLILLRHLKPHLVNHWREIDKLEGSSYDQ